MQCPVTQVEETKRMIKMLPIFVATFIPNTIMAQGHTLFVKQGTILDRSMGPGFYIPAAGLSVFSTLSMLISLVIYDRCFVPAIRKCTKNPRGITLLQRMGIGVVMHMLTMIIAALCERKKLQTARDKGILQPKEEVPLTIFIILPQFVLLGMADGFLEVAKMEFFYDQAPEEMKNLGASDSTSSSVGIGHFLSSFILSTVKDITKRHGEEGWVHNILNTSHLDYYYMFLAVLTAINFVFFLFVSKSYSYNADVRGCELEVQKVTARVVPSEVHSSVVENASLEADGNSQKHL